MTLADQVTLARLGLMPLIVGAYLLLPVQHSWCFWAAGLLCALAEYTDLIDGRIARQRGEVSDFGKLADPFCDVVYRIGVFLAFLLPAGGVGWAVTTDPAALGLAIQDASTRAEVLAFTSVGQPVYALAGGGLGAGLVPWLPVFLMVLREVVAGALRAMTATKGLVLAARTSGKVKAWLQGTTIITCLAFPSCFWIRAEWMLTWAFWATWICAVVSVASIIEYIWVNRPVLLQLVDRRPQP
jgi:CDP-diacylglycerol--glycerol-3-phosphate 3-phosphatidyltransferase